MSLPNSNGIDLRRIASRIIARRNALRSLLEKKEREGAQSSEAEKQVQVLAAKILRGRELLSEHGFEPDEVLRNAVAEADQANKTATRGDPKNIKSGGVGKYSLGAKPKHWK